MDIGSGLSKNARKMLEEDRKRIENLELENQNMRRELSLEKQVSKVASGAAAMKEIERLQNQGDLYTKKIEQEKKKIKQLDKRREEVQLRLQQQRKRMGGINASKENNRNIAKQIRILESRLDKALMKYNETLANNTELRKKIDGLRQERVVFDGIYKKLENELQGKQEIMAKLIEQSNQAYQARDAAKEEMRRIQIEGQWKQASFEKQWKELGEAIEADRKMKDFMKVSFE